MPHELEELQDQLTLKVITVRMSASQHRLLKSAAHAAEKSLNQYCLDRLAEPLATAPEVIDS